jgi:hypothetical protein
LVFSTHHDEEGSKEQDFGLDVEISRESDPTTLVLLRTFELEGGVSVLKLELTGKVAGDGANVCGLKVRSSRVNEVLLKKSLKYRKFTEHRRRVYTHRQNCSNFVYNVYTSS